MIKTKEQIIEYFRSGVKETKDFKIGIEHEKFLFFGKEKKRVNFEQIKNVKLWCSGEIAGYVIEKSDAETKERLFTVLCNFSIVLNLLLLVNQIFLTLSIPYLYTHKPAY